MQYLLGIAAVAWIVVGAFVVGNALELTASTVSVLHQQYIMVEFILGALLCSFGMLMLGLAGVIEAVRARAPSPTPERETMPTQDEVTEAVRDARDAMARRPYHCSV